MLYCFSELIHVHTCRSVASDWIKQFRLKTSYWPRHSHTPTHTHMQPFACMNSHTQMPITIHAHTCMHIHAHTHTCVRMHTHARTHTHTHTHTHTQCIHIYTHTCLHRWSLYLFRHTLSKAIMTDFYETTDDWMPFEQFKLFYNLHYPFQNKRC